MASEIGIVKALVGTAVATASDGSQRTLHAGDKVFQDEVITTGAAGAVEVEFSDGSLMTLGRSSQTVLDIDAFDPQAVAQAPTAAVDSEIDALQQALLEGADPSQIGEATAAGAGAGAGGNEGTDFVQVLYEAPEVTPESGFDTTGITVAFEDERDVDVFDDTPTAGTTIVLLDEDDIYNFAGGKGEEGHAELRAAFDAIKSDFETAEELSAHPHKENGPGLNDEQEGDDLPPDAKVFVSSLLNADFGADGPGDIVFNAEGTQPAGLTSGGEDIQYWVSVDGHSLVAYIDYDHGYRGKGPQGEDSGEESEDGNHAHIIFTAEITDVTTGEFQVMLLGPVDHPDGTSEDNLFVNLGFTISDLDGDTAAGVLRLDIDDDSPVIVEDYYQGGEDNDRGEDGPRGFPGKGEDLAIDEDDIEGRGNQDYAVGDDYSNTYLHLPLNFGADGPAENDPVSLSAEGIVDQNGNTLTSNGVELQYTWDSDTDTLIGYTDDVNSPVLTISVNHVYQNGAELNIDLLDNLDHPQNSFEDNLEFDVGYTVTDFDGDSVSSTFGVDIDDDMPTIVPQRGAVDEEGFPTGNAGDSYPETEVVGLTTVVQGDPTGNVVDHWYFSHDGGVLTIDIDSESYHGDLNGDSSVNGFDTYIYVFNADTGVQVGRNDDSDGLDSYLNLNLPAGNYDLAVGTFSLSESEARSGSQDHSMGPYNVTFGGDNDGVELTSMPVGGTIIDGALDSGDLDGEALTAQGSLGIGWGADDRDVDGTDAANPEYDRSVSFDAQAAPEGLMSNGVPVIYSISEDGLTLTAMAGETVVFTVVITDEGTGTYDFTLLANLDHPEGATTGEDGPGPQIPLFSLPDGEDFPEGEDSPSGEDSPGTEDDINLSFDFTATDSDGDAVSSHFTITVDDDAPVIGVGEDAPERSVVDEEGLATAATQDDGYDGDVAGFALKANGDLNISWGSDDNNDGGAADRSVTFDANQYGVSGLTSNGINVEYSISPDGTVLTATAGGTPVFTVTLSDLESGSYDFELHDNLDHSRSKTGGIDTEDNLNIKFSFTATDSDGDTASDAFTVSVDDDGPVIGEALSENDDNSILLGARDGSAGLDDWGVTPGALTGAVTMNGVTANISFQDNDSNPSSMLRIYNNDADHIGGGSIGDNDNEGINAGETLTISFDKLMQQAEIGVDGLGNHFLPGASQQAHATWVAYKNGVQVGSGEIDNPEGQNEGPAGLLEVFTVSIPGGFDSIVLGNNSNNDGSNYEVRYLQAQTLNIVDEEGMPEGNLGDSYSDNGDVAGAALTTSADLNIIWGADDNNRGTADRSITFDYQLPPDGFMSNGVQVVYNYNVGEDLLTATAGHGGPTVFTVTLSDLESGSFEFRLLDNLDHDHRSGANTEDDINLTFAFTATDSDGDTVNGSFAVTVDDDGPVIDLEGGQGNDSSGSQQLFADEDDLIQGNDDHKEGDDDAGDDNGYSSIHLPVYFGADGPAEEDPIRLRTDNLPELSSNDVAVTWEWVSAEAGDDHNGQLVGSADGTTVVTITVDHVYSGDVSVSILLSDNLDHPDAPGPGSYEENIRFDVEYTATDFDGDSVDGSFSINIDDDGPTIDVAATQESMPTLTTQDADTIDVASDTASGSFAGLFTLTQDMGADEGGTDASLSYELYVTEEVSGLSSNGEAITLTLNTGTGVIEGSTSAGVVFEISVDASGNVQLTQHEVIDHVGEASDLDATNNSVNNLGLAAGTVALTASAKIVDGDGDSVRDAQEIDISGAISFDDDTPTIGVEIVGEGGNPKLKTQDADTIGDASATASESYAFLFSLTSNTNMGADGAAEPSLSYALSVTNTVSGLSSDGEAITLALNTETGAIEGSTTNGDVIFAISVDAATGSVTLTQHAAIDHVGEGDDDNGFNGSVDNLALVAGNVVLTASATITDGDGDSATDSQSVDISTAIWFGDAHPDALTNDNKTVQEGDNTVDGYLVREGEFPGGGFGADGPAALQIVSLEHEDSIYTTASDNYDLGTKSLTIDTDAGGSITVNFETGVYTYTSPVNVNRDSSEYFVYVIEDGDGDQKNGQLIIKVEDSVPTAVVDTDSAVEGYWERGADISSETNVMVWSESSATSIPPQLAYVLLDPDGPNFLVGGGNDWEVGYIGPFSIEADSGHPAQVSAWVKALNLEIDAPQVEFRDIVTISLYKATGVGTGVELVASDYVYTSDLEQHTFDVTSSGEYAVVIAGKDNSDGLSDLVVGLTQVEVQAYSLVPETTITPKIEWVDATPAVGNVLDNDIASLDGDLTVTMVNDVAVVAGGIDIVGNNGSLHIDELGAYIYTPNAEDMLSASLAVPDVFTYRITDENGSISESTLTIDIANHAYSSETPSADDDFIAGTEALDILDGLAGNDVIYGGAGDDEITGGADNDLLIGGAGNDILSGGDGVDILSGGAGDDTLSGGDDNDILIGGAGKNTLYGGDGADSLLGGVGVDTLYGGKGADSLYGAAGADIFAWNQTDVGTEATPAHDTVADFDASEDVLNLADLLGDSSHTIEGIEVGAAGSEHLQLNIKDGGGNIVQEIELSGVAAGIDPNATLQSLLDNNIINDGS